MPTVAISAIGSLIRNARKGRGISRQAELADRAGLSIDTVSRIERGANGTIDTLEAIARALGYDDALDMLRTVEAARPDRLNADGQKIVQLLPALKPRQLKKLRAAAREMIDADDGE